MNGGDSWRLLSGCEPIVPVGWIGIVLSNGDCSLDGLLNVSVTVAGLTREMAVGAGPHFMKRGLTNRSPVEFWADH
ncbi:MAG: hypothetical protein M2R45_00551 [Verrucomicrobia subdivision 3 bacterium]|nr:hypothetical protein [Limisphaerales bacterium]MCS1413571.1 hypothetical protein [Limisphaerales bacterium]